MLVDEQPFGARELQHLLDVRVAYLINRNKIEENKKKVESRQKLYQQQKVMGQGLFTQEQLKSAGKMHS